MAAEPDVSEPPALSTPWYVIATVFVAVWVLAIAPLFAGLMPDYGDGADDRLAILTWTFVTLHGAVAAIVIFVLNGCLPPGQRLEAIAMDRYTHDVWHRAVGSVLTIVPAIILLNIISIQLATGLGWEFEQNPALLWIHDSPPAVILLLLFMIVVAAPVTEELLFRQVIYRTVDHYLGQRWATHLTAVLFAVCHQIPAQVPALYVLGLVLQRSLARTGSLWQPIAIHATFNAFMVLLSMWFGAV